MLQQLNQPQRCIVGNTLPKVSAKDFTRIVCLWCINIKSETFLNNYDRKMTALHTKSEKNQ